ncbi:MAG: FAD-dependent oxidoreductase, partial [Bacteroidota bacterium]
MTYDFDLIVLGGGAAGLTASGIGANLGVKTLMIERERHTVPDGAHPAKLGGDCTWTGCVPSKALLKAAKVAHQLRHAADYGLVTTAPEVDFKRVMDHVRHIRDDVFEEADRPEIYEDMGIEVRVGTAR